MNDFERKVVKSMEKRIFIIGSALVFCCVAEGSGITELKGVLPEIFAKSAAHYKVLDAAVTPLMKNSEGQTMVPQGYRRDKKMYHSSGPGNYSFIFHR